MTSYAELTKSVRALCDSVAESPQARRELRVKFYDKYGYKEADGFSYGDSELDFLDWEIRRGVLNSLSDPVQPGSAWWRDVNLQFIYFSELAGQLFEHGLMGDVLPTPVQKWLTYLVQPSPETWYRAHNSSILAGFQQCLANARDENEVEQDFLNIVLYRLMFAQAMVEDASMFGEIGDFVADPRGFAVEIIVSQPHFYPTHYPLSRKDRNTIEGRGFSLQDFEVRLLDDRIIQPRLQELYRRAAYWNDAPYLLQFQDNGTHCYPNPTPCPPFTNPLWD